MAEPVCSNVHALNCVLIALIPTSLLSSVPEPPIYITQDFVQEF